MVGALSPIRTMSYINGELPTGPVTVSVLIRVGGLFPAVRLESSS